MAFLNPFKMRTAGVYPKMPTQGALRVAAEALGKSIPGAGAAERMRDWGGAPDGRSCAYVDIDSTEAFGVAGHGVYEGQKRYPHSADLRREASEFRGAKLLGEGLLGFDCGAQRGGRPKVYPRTREGRQATRTVGTVRGRKPL